MSRSSMRGIENLLYMKTIIHLLNILKLHFICSIKRNTQQHSNSGMRKLWKNSEKSHWTYFNPFKPNGISTNINRTSLSPFSGLLDGIFHFHSNSNRTLCKETVETLIRRRVQWRLIWECIVCLCPTKRMLGLYYAFTIIPYCACLQFVIAFEFIDSFFVASFLYVVFTTFVYCFI